MAYKFGQLTNQSINDYSLVSITVTQDKTDKGNPKLIGTFEQNVNYKFNINIYENDVEDQEGRQKKIEILLGTRGPIVDRFNFGKDLTSHQTIFSPSLDTSQIILRDYTQNWVQDYNNFDYTIYKVPNLLENTTEQRWLRMGFHGRPGQIIVVNHAPIMLGRSGMFELHNDIKIKHFSIIPNSDGEIDAFILDYMYEEG